MENLATLTLQRLSRGLNIVVSSVRVFDALRGCQHSFFVGFRGFVFVNIVSLAPRDSERGRRSRRSP
jgi:hypothetical protein